MRRGRGMEAHPDHITSSPGCSTVLYNRNNFSFGGKTFRDLEKRFRDT
jgi:hypothetical protein